MGAQVLQVGSKNNRKVDRKQWIWLAIAIVAAIGLPLYFQSVGNFFFVRIFALMGLYVVLALGLNITVGYAGLLDLGYIAFYAVGAYVGMLLGLLLPEAIAGAGYWVLLPVSALGAAFAGLVIGFPVLRLRGDYLAIVTLGFGESVRIALTNDVFGLTRGPKGLPGPGESVAAPAGQAAMVEALSFGDFRFSTDLWWYYMIAILCVIAIFVIRRLDDSRLGRAWIAMREDEIAAASVGVNIQSTKLWAFALGAVWGGIGGITFTYWIGFISPESFNFMESVLVVCMVVLGGMGSIPGVVLGAAIIAGLPEMIRWTAQSEFFSQFLTMEQANMAGQYRFLVFAVALIFMMIFRPQGILPSKRRALELHPDHAKNLMEQNQSMADLEAANRAESRHRGGTR
ncbi:MAG: ABC transporter ATP-binding protein [Actinobacteria bacterium]|nr:ABC transporter ATP-binding protein [Actinomycetota bacterium]